MFVSLQISNPTSTSHLTLSAGLFVWRPLHVPLSCPLPLYYLFINSSFSLGRFALALWRPAVSPVDLRYLTTLATSLYNVFASVCVSPSLYVCVHHISSPFLSYCQSIRYTNVINNRFVIEGKPKYYLSISRANPPVFICV